MHIRFAALAVGLLLSVEPAASSGNVDCIYVGRGEAYDYDGNHLIDKSFDLRIERVKVASGNFLFNEIKTFKDGSQTHLQFNLGWYIGPFHFDDGAGRVVKGICLNHGYCVGKNEFPYFKGNFTTRFSSREILTTTTSSDLIIDEVVRPVNAMECPFHE